MAFPLTGELLGVRVDEGAILPVATEHDRPVEMLLYQMQYELDAIGRFEAILRLADICTGGRHLLCDRVKQALEDRSQRDPSRLVRDAARNLSGQK